MSIVNGPKIATMVSAANGDTYGDGDRHQLRTQQGLIQANVISMVLSTPPGSPVNGNTYVVGASPTGLWAGQANSIAYWAVDPQDGPSITPNIATGAWEFYTPLAGWQVFDNNSGLTWRFNGSNWNFTRIASTAAFVAVATFAVAFPAGPNGAVYTGTNAPIVNVTAVGSTPAALGSVWVTNTGSAGAWTGFSINTTTAGTQTFNYAVEG